jgi:thioredoxin-like negative regulator of GroEL
VFTNRDVVELSRSFVCIRVDAERSPDIARRHGVASLPTTVFLHYAGRELHRFSGYRPPAEYVAEMKLALGPAQPASERGRKSS